MTGAVDIDLIKDDALRQATVAQIYHFGQTPSQLFDKPHPHQKPLDASNPTPHACFPFSPKIRSSPKLSWASESKLGDSMFSDIVLTRSDMLVHCYADDKGDLRYRSRALTLVSAASLPSISVPIKIRKSSGISALSRTGQLLLCGGMAKGALECYLCPTGRLISRSYAGHYAPITCMQIDPDQSYLITGLCYCSPSIFS
ncbi:hypothetical protein BVRB_024360 [Beta vulgaris subsp. vulgaris]|uniref:BEACH domain-containing protein n=1 Tax=Beta vulgaris subsp. vulgaris TaxID=3555 RepID=A0A0J8AZE0_BETVV|nr:hypothetical protein BVRB_024360 [Beta vulgaris subsp. vulgaris]